MILTKLVKCIIHVYAKNGELQYSYWYPGDYTFEDTAEMTTNEWCRKENTKAGYTKFTFESVKLYGEATKW